MITLTTQTLQVDGSKNVNCLKIDNINQRKTLRITRQGSSAVFLNRRVARDLWHQKNTKEHVSLLN